MSVNRGKDFEHVIADAFKSVPNTSVIRLQDSMNGFKGMSNVSDFIIYHYPIQYFIECKSCNTNTLNFRAISQWDKLLEQAHYTGVQAGVFIWFVEKDVTVFVDILALEEMRLAGYKSVNVKDIDALTLQFRGVHSIDAEKKRVFFTYDIQEFLDWSNEEVFRKIALEAERNKSIYEFE